MNALSDTILQQLPLLADSRFSWPGLNNFFWINGLLVLSAAAILIYLLKQERQLVPKSVGGALLLFRLVILIMILLTLLQPTLVKQIDQELAGKVILGIDQSQSMSSIDQHASPEEKLKWARAMKLLRPETTLEIPKPTPDPSSESSSSDSLQQQAHEQNLKQVFQQLGTTTRESILQQTLEQQHQEFQHQLQQNAQVEQLVFAANSLPLNNTNPDNNEQVPLTLSAPPELDRTKTSLTELLKQAIQTSAASPVNGVILFTDGQHNADQKLKPTLNQLSQLKIPVYPVLLGSEKSPADILIKELDYHASVYTGDKAYVSAVVQADEFQNTNLQLQLYREETLIKQEELHTGSQLHLEKQLTFSLPTEEPGTHHYQLKIVLDPEQSSENQSDQQTRESTPDNNEVSFTQNVLDNTIKVLLIDRQPRWEFRYLHNALERDEKISLTTVLLNPPALTDVDQPEANVFEQQLSLPRDYSQSSFAGYDLIILGNVTLEDLSASDAVSSPSLGWEHLEHYVANEGGSLVLIPGEVMIYQWDVNPVLGLLAPILKPEKIAFSTQSGPGLPTGMKLLPTLQGNQESFLQFAENSEENEQIWNELPTQFHLFSGQPKIAASNLVAAHRREEDPPLPTFVQHQYGEGQVLWLGTDATWRWRFRRGDEYHHRFWGQVARWATRNKLAVQTDLVRFGPDQAEVTPGQPVRIQAFWSKESQEDLGQHTPVVELYSLPLETDSPPLQTLPLQSLPDRPLAQEALINNLPVGDYQLELKLPDSDLLQSPVIAPLSIRPEPSLEMIETTANRELLTQVASITGGELFELDQIQRIPELLQQNTRTQSFTAETPLWDHWLWLLLLLTVLAAEWILRKWNGLP